MARPSKANKQPVEAGPVTMLAGQQKVIDVEAFQRVRDSVFARLGSIQQMLKDISHDYLRQTSMLMGEATDLGNAPDMQSFEQALSMLPQGMPILPLVAPVEEKKRKKRSHDPDAPKRPLTPYFLYMQTARPIIAQDLGADAPKGAVQEEGQRRWGTMNAHDKLGWDQAYQYNLRLYNARVHSYKGGNASAKHMSDDDALKYAEQFNIPMPTGKDQALLEQHVGNDHDAIAEQLQQHIPVEEEEEAPAKTPKSAKKDGRKRKVATPAVEADTTIQSGAAASPEKKRKRASKVTEEKEPEPKKSGRKKAKSG